MSEITEVDLNSDRRAPVLSIVLVNWNTRSEMRDCLTSVFERTPNLAFEVIVVDNASTDTSVAMLAAEFPQVTVIANNVNVGFAKACNQGMAISKGHTILLLNSDTYVRDDVIARMAHYVCSRPEIGMAGCQLRYPNGTIQHTPYRSLSIWRTLFEDFWLYKLVPSSKRDEILLGGYWKSDREIEVDWLAGAFMLLRREVFEEVGGFSEDFFMYGEDSEWCARIRRAGRKIFYNPIGIVYHVGNVSSDKEWTEKERLRLCHLGGLRSYAKSHGPVLGLMYHLANLLGTSVRFAVYSVLTAIQSNDYYRGQRRFYGWQAGFYCQAFWPSSGATGSRSSAQNQGT